MYLILHKNIYLTHDARIVDDFKDMQPPGTHVHVDDTGRSVLHVDFGGALLEEEEPVEIEALGRRFSFYAHQHLSLLNGLNRGLEAVSPAGFIEVETFLHTLLIDEEVAFVLRENINEALGTIRRLESDYLNRWEQAMNSLQGTGFVALPEDKEPDA